MKAATLHKIGDRFQIEDVPVPTIAPDEVLVETRTCGICRTDLHIQDGLAYIPGFPHISGHEPAGVVAAIGASVDSFKIGQRVAPYLFLTCDNCHYCRTGRDAQCSHVKGILGVTTQGGFAEFFKVPARNLLALPATVSFEAGGLVSCAVITAVHAYRRARLGLNDVAVVLGAGGIGQILVQILKGAGIKTVALGRSSQGLEMMKKAGADLALALGPDAIKQIKDFAGGEGARCVFECVGAAATMKLAGEAAQRGGQIIVIGEEPEFPQIDSIQIAQRELEIIGSRNGSRQDARDALAWMASGVIQPPIVGRFALEELNEAMHLLRTGQAHGRLIILVQAATR